MWDVRISGRTAKALQKLPAQVRGHFYELAKDIEIQGPYRANWAHYGKLKNQRFHCHVKSGRPTYVACWTIMNKTEKIVEIDYAGTHENAPY